MASFYGGTFDDVFANVVNQINRWPMYESSPRGQKCREIIAPTIVVSNPRARLLANPGRDANYGFAVGEFFWYWLGKQDLESISYYNKRMPSFSNDGFTVNSAYGFRTRVKKYMSNDAVYKTQWTHVRNELLRDPDSRRAVLIIADPLDFAVMETSKDVPCTLSLQFFVRDNKLHLHTTMRSNDAFWGLTYDFFSFTLLQECMMLELKAAGMKDLELGAYSHTAGSLHIYERHFGMASEVWNNYMKKGFVVAAPMEPISLEELASLADVEAELRTGKVADIGQDRFSGGVRWMAEQLVAHRRKRDDERGRQVGPSDGPRAA